MSAKGEHYYKPYISEEEVDSDEESVTSSDTEFDTAARGLDDPRYAIIRSTGPAFNTINEQLLYQKGNGLGSTYIPETHSNSSKSPLYTDPKKTIQTTLFSFKSSNRDKRVWPTSSDFEIKLSRPYKNVTQIQLVQVTYQYFINTVVDSSGFLSTIITYLSSIGFTDASECLCCFHPASVQNSIGITEIGRTNPVNSSQPLTHIITVRPGKYDGNLLIQEMDYQMNKTPPFNIIPYKDHRQQFRTTKNLLHLFNEHGRYFNNRATGEFMTLSSKRDIHNQYYPESFVHTHNQPNEHEVFVAYYYPVLKEAMMSIYDHMFLDLLGNSYSTMYTRTVQHFEGLDSPLYYSLCSSNLPYLSKYRDQHTFKYNPIHQYDWYYDPGTKQNTVKHHILHPSIQRDITNQHASNFLTATHKYGLTSLQYSTLVTQNEKTKAVLTDLQKTLDNALTIMGVPFSLYIPTVLANPISIISTINSELVYPEYLSETETVLHDLATGLLQPSTFGGVYAHIPIYNFDWITLSDLVNDSQNYSITPANFNPIYASKLYTLNNESIISEQIGGSYIPGYSGASVISTDFTSLYSTFIGYHTLYQTQTTTLTNVTTTQSALTRNYVHTKYNGVFPPSLLSNNAYLGNLGTGQIAFKTDPITLYGSSPFDTSTCDKKNPCCKYIQQQIENWYGCMPSEYVITTLPWKLGLAVTPSEILSFLSTIAVSNISSPFNIYLQLNVEQSMNNMDVAMNENVTITNDPVSQAKVVLGKLLTEGAGLADLTQTIIQNPATFQTPIGKLDRLHFTMLLDDGLIPISKLIPFSLSFTEWDAVIQIDEEVGILDRATQLSSIPTVKIPDDKIPF